jgi:NAD(P)-dependent dehydrogenase (short-subunit alcohol dehydrogenase family)
VVVTGASTGIGAATVAGLVGRGFTVWAGVRRDTDAEELTAEHGDSVRPLLLDVTDPDAVAAAGAAVTAAGPLHGLVNNAGVALPGPLEYLPVRALRDQLEVNLIGQLAVTQAMLPALRAATGRIVMIGSIGGRIGSPMLGAYSVSKFGLAGMSDSLRAELAPWKIRVILIEPGPIATPIWGRGEQTAESLLAGMPPEAEDRYGRHLEQTRATARRHATKGAPPELAAAVVVRALTHHNPAPRVLVGTPAKIGALIARLPFRLQYRLVASR